MTEPTLQETLRDFVAREDVTGLLHMLSRLYRHTDNLELISTCLAFCTMLGMSTTDIVRSARTARGTDEEIALLLRKLSASILAAPRTADDTPIVAIAGEVKAAEWLGLSATELQARRGWGLGRRP